ncbi:MAG: sulfotransferase family 2 domain-containing protein [Proteobacteria bacterium]|nr:sulfotransferase family 2 domain-containing protein [Pseudomonadota bacterium]
MSKKAAFMHIPKTGGASIRQLCNEFNIAIILHNLRDSKYLSLVEYRRQNPGVISFAVVRNPWDRLVSGYFFLKCGGIKPEDKIDADRFVNKHKDFNEFVEHAFNDDEILNQIHFRPQHLWISDNNKLIVDYLARFEDLQQSVSGVLNEIGYPARDLTHINKSHHQSYKKYYSEESIKAVRKIYSKDIELFEYDF